MNQRLKMIGMCSGVLLLSAAAFALVAGDEPSKKPTEPAPAASTPAASPKSKPKMPDDCTAVPVKPAASSPQTPTDAKSPAPATPAMTTTNPNSTATPAATPATHPTQSAIFGAGCFWGVEAAFRRTPGVLATEVGYTGGKTKNPTYKDVCNHDTGHAEVVRVVFDPKKITFDQLLDVFFKNHDPTQVNRQGPDIGDQYRTAIFFQNDEQKAQAEAKKAKLQASGKYKRPIATEITKAATFYRAEEYHQQYLEKRGVTHCHIPSDGTEDTTEPDSKP